MHVETFGRYGAARARAKRIPGFRKMRRLGPGRYMAVGKLGLPLAAVDRMGDFRWQIAILPQPQG